MKNLQKATCINFRFFFVTYIGKFSCFYGEQLPVVFFAIVLVYMCQSAKFGISILIWKLDPDFVDKSYFSKIRINPVMLRFLATTESHNKNRSENLN